MSPRNDTDIWTAPRLIARLAALKGLAPAPVCYLIWRATTRERQAESCGYELPGLTGRQDEPALQAWLAERDLAGAQRLAVSVLAIRETLDAAGMLREGVLERRRGGIDGPYYGKVARVEFTGAAKLVRRYQARDGRLAELPPDNDIGTVPPAEDLDTESFAGEDAAIHAFLGAGAVIVNRRAPTLFEDLLGVSTIVHARRPDGTTGGYGVGWHGTAAFVLAADFPRHDQALLPPPDLDAAVAAAAAAHDLIPHETRLDERGFCGPRPAL